MRSLGIISTAILLVFATSSVVSADRGNFGPNIRQSPFYTPSLLPAGQDAFSDPSSSDPLTVARDFVVSRVTRSDFRVQSSYTDDHTGVTHVYFRQLVAGREVANADMNVNIDRNGRVISYGESFYHGKAVVRDDNNDNDDNDDGGDNILDNTLGQVVLKTGLHRIKVPKVLRRRRLVPKPEPNLQIRVYETPKLTPVEALQAFMGLPLSGCQSAIKGDPQSGYVITGAPFALSPIPIVEKYLQTESGWLEPVWDLQVEMQDNWFHAQVHAHTGEVLARIDWVADASYNVFAFGQNDPEDGPAQLVYNPNDAIASPKGWHIQKNTFFNITIGNNVYAQENTDGGWQWEDNYRPDGGDNLDFNFPVVPKEQEPKEYLDAAVTNLFYWNNIIHDLFYRYGFNEAAGNFQEHNAKGTGGLDGDAVIANAQDGSGYNNANFATPPDGQHGKMRMYVWDQTSPMRDGDLESGIIVHEYAHGISTRLTGGPDNSGCLGWGEPGSMGEGWGDFFATIFRMQPGMNRTVEFGMGDWANGGHGIRKYKYSTSKKTNPETYKFMDKPGYWGVHAGGAVWAEMLFEVYWNLVEKHGFTPDYFPPLPKNHESLSREEIANHAKGHILSHGNTLLLQLVVDGMKLQPCRPGFVDARDAILQADEILTDGDNACEIWKGFAKRGLGVGAKLVGGSPWGGGEREESFKVPKQCSKGQPKEPEEPDPEDPEEPEEPEDFVSI